MFQKSINRAPCPVSAIVSTRSTGSESAVSLRDKLLSKTESLSNQAVRYLFVGGIAFVADFAVMVGLTELLRLHYSWGVTAGFGAGLAVNYLLSIFWVFSERNVSDSKIEFLIFSLIGVVGLLLTHAIVWFGAEVLIVKYWIAKIAAVALVLVWNFSARKFLLFRNGVTEAPAAPEAAPEGNL